MNKEDFVKITNSLYQLTLLFPKKEPLRFKIRELAGDILNNSVVVFGVNPSQPKNLILETEKNLEVLNSFFEVAKAQNWVAISEILKIQQEYSKLKEELEKTLESRNLSKTKVTKANYNIERKIPLRQERILAILREKEQLQVKDLKEVFPQISKRTLRRDFEQLFKKGLVARLGEKNNTFYQIS